MRLVPIIRRSRIDMQRQRQQHRREWRILHDVLHHRQRRRYLLVGHLKDQFVVDLQQHLRREFLLRQRVFHPDHGAADDVGGGALQWRAR